MTSQPDEHTIAAATHGRYLVREGSPERLLVGFHGYAENAETHLGELLKIRGIDQWTVVAVQALNRFYAGRTQRVVAGWMTSEDRELMIPDNLAYVQSVVDRVRGPLARTLVFAGFSQGVAMAYRAAADIPCDGVIALAGDVPPDVTESVPPALLGRGTADDWYTAEKLDKDLRFLETITNVTTCVFDGGHEWTDTFRNAAADYLQRIAAL